MRICHAFCCCSSSNAYFSTSGPAKEGEILLSNLDCATGTKGTLPALKSYSAAFCVNGG